MTMHFENLVAQPFSLETQRSLELCHQYIVDNRSKAKKDRRNSLF